MMARGYEQAGGPREGRRAGNTITPRLWPAEAAPDAGAGPPAVADGLAAARAAQLAGPGRAARRGAPGRAGRGPRREGRVAAAAAALG